MEDVRLLNNSKFGDYVESINPIELKIKNTTGCDSYHDLNLEKDSEGRLTTNLYDKRDTFN